MEPSIETLLEQARTGQVSLDALRWRLVPEPARRVLARAALVHAFDARLLREVLNQGLEPVQLEQLVTLPFVERLPTLEGFYCVRERVRRAQLQQWTGQQPVEDGVPRSREKFRQLSSELAAYYAQLGPEWQGERLYHLQAVAPDEARTLFEALFQEAESRFDIGRCHDLLNQLSERAAELPEQHELRRLAEDYRPRFESRALWSEEYYRSTRLQERPDLLKEVAELLGSPQCWILQLFATGGMGKSSFLWWVIARYFVPQGTACARIDFDDVRSGADEPWRLLLHLAHQLKLQVRGPDLERLEYELLKIESASSGPGSLQVDAEYSREVADRFAYALLESGHQTPVVLIFDTLEEALLHRGTALVTLLEQLASIRKTFPLLKVLLSGRYDLRERIEGMEKKFGPELKSVEILPFTEAQARQYLTGRRGFSSNDTRADAVLRKAEGVPFKLSLLADHVQRTGASAEEIDAYPAVDMLYVIKRVVERIEEPQVRWLLRYGVIPRKLTLSFVEKVMARYLPPAMAGTSTLDHPEDDKLPTQPFRTDLLGSPQEPVDIRELWRKLTRYATEADYGWVRRVVGPQDALVFHENVVNPMRRLLQEHEVFHQLHEDAAELYERKAGSPSNPGWIDDIREAIYHRFQRLGTGAEGFWRKQLERARTEGKPGWRLLLAKEILGSEYLDSDNRPRLRRDDTPMVSMAALFEANLELAEVNLELLSTQEDRRQRLQEANAALDWAHSIEKELDPRGVVSTRLVAAEARLAFERGDASRALRLVQAVSMGEQGLEEQLTLRMIEADALRALGSNPLPALRKVQRLLDTSPAAGRSLRRIWLSEELSAWDQHADAIRMAAEAEMAVHQARKGNLSEDAQRYSLRRVEAHLLASQPGAAAQLLRQLSPLGIEGQFLEARVSLARGAPDIALKQLQAMPHERSPKRLLGPELKQQAQIRQLSAVARARQLRFNDATEYFEDALNLWRQAEGSEGYDRCLRAYVAFLLHDVGNLTIARQILEGRKRGRTRSAGLEFVRLRLLEAQLLAAEGQPAQALELLARVARWRVLSPGLRARIALERSILRDVAAPNIKRLEECLLEVQTVSARLVILRALRRITKLSRRAAERLLRLVPLNEPLHPEDMARAVLRRAELHRFTGDSQVRNELEVLEPSNLGLEFRREMMLLQDRLDWPPAARAPVWRGLPEFRLAGPPERLVGAFLLEEVERKLRFGLDKDSERNTRELSALLKAARHHLGEEIEQTSLWDLRLAAARATVEGTEEGPLESKDGSFTTVESIRSVLGIPQTRPTSSNPDSRREFQVRLRSVKEGQLKVETQWPGRDLVFRSVERSGLVEMLSSAKKTPVPYDAVRPLANDWRRASRELGQLLLQNAEPMMLAALDIPMDLRLRASPFMHAMPWELALFQSERPNLDLLASIHGIVRDRERVLRPSEKFSGQETPKPDTNTGALVVPSENDKRGRVLVYKRHFSGLIRQLNSLNQELLLQNFSLGSNPFRLLHFRVEMTESSHGGPAIRLARELQQQSNTMPEDSEELTPSLLASVLYKLPSRRLRPLVVLDIERPRGITEMLRQVFLRNVFAAELFSLGVCSAVLCTGLADFELDEEMTDILVTNLMGGESLGTISQRLRQVALKVIGSGGDGDISLEAILGPASTALFATDPHFRPFPQQPEKL